MKAIFLVAIILPFGAFSQLIVENKADKFTKQHKVETARELLKGGFTTNLYVTLRSVDTTCFLIVAGTGQGADVIGDKERILFLLDNDSTIAAYSTGVQDYAISVSSGISINHYNHQYAISIDDLKYLTNRKVKSIRKYGNNHYNDIDVKGKNSEKLGELSAALLKAIGK